MRRAYKFRIYPTTGQAFRLAQCLRDHQRLYNAALEERREAWRMRKVSIRYGQQSAQLKDIRAADPDQGRWSFSSQQATLRRLDKAMAAFYRRCKAGQNAGYPRFKALDRWDSWGGRRRRRVPVEAGRGPRVPSGHRSRQGPRPPRRAGPRQDDQRQAGRPPLVRGPVCDDVPARPMPVAGREIGMDVGVARFATTSDGEVIASPRYTRKSADEWPLRSSPWPVSSAAPRTGGGPGRKSQKSTAASVTAAPTFTTRPRARSSASAT